MARKPSARTRSKALETYRGKRDFTRTAEPSGRKSARGGEGWRFVVQKHAARRLHFDFRLELDGVLKSWAVTRGPSLDPSVKRLAVRTEDHPVEYGAFEGTIPKGEYGGGTVLLWDRGTWVPRGDPRRDLADGVLKFDLFGERLKGGFALVRLKHKERERRENWLLIKERDAQADPDFDPVEEWTSSVSSGRDLDAIATGDAPVWSSKGAHRRHGVRPRKGSDPKHRHAILPAFVPPQLATLAAEPPHGDDWIHEIKYDGYRVLAATAGGRAKLYTRSGHDWTDRFDGVADAVSRLAVDSALLDGEVVAFNAEGRIDFSRLQQTLKEGGDGLVYFAFDLLSLDGKDLRSEPLLKRKSRLASVLAKTEDPIRYSEHFAGDGRGVLAKACELGLEGLVSKRVDRPYVSARTLNWLKSKCLGRDEFVIGGYRRSDKKGRPFASLLLGEFEDGALRYRGRVGAGYNDETLADLGKKLAALKRDKSPFESIPPEARRGARWVEPRLVAEIAYSEFTADGVLRHGRFLGLREDKPAREVNVSARTKAKPAGKEKRGREAGARPKASRDAGPDVKLTHPDKVLFPAANLTKQALADYLEVVAPLMLPHVVGRPLSLVRCPEGADGQCFFQKHRTAGLPPALKAITITENDGERADYIMIADAKGLIGAAQIGALEIHVWGSRGRSIERPDRLVFDLDPGPGVDFADVRQAGADVRDVLKAAGLTSFPLVTGGKGVHVVAPLARRQEWPEVKAFAKGLASRLADDDPTRFIATMSKAKRQGRIFIDWLRNERGATAIAPYSPRAKAAATVATPLSWTELARVERADAFPMATVLRRVRSGKGEAWAGYFEVNQSIAKAAMMMFRVDDR